MPCTFINTYHEDYSNEKFIFNFLYETALGQPYLFPLYKNRKFPQVLNGKRIRVKKMSWKSSIQTKIVVSAIVWYSKTSRSHECYTLCIFIYLSLAGFQKSRLIKVTIVSWRITNICLKTRCQEYFNSYLYLRWQVAEDVPKLI